MSQFPHACTTNFTVPAVGVMDDSRAYRHNPYSTRGGLRVDVRRDVGTIPLRFANGETGEATELRVSARVVVRPNIGAIDLRPKDRSTPTPGPKHGAACSSWSAAAADADGGAADATCAANPVSADRKAARQAHDAAKVPLDEPLYELVFDLSRFYREVSREDADRAVAASRAASRRSFERPGDAAALRDDMIVNVRTSMIGLPNVDGHRIAQELLTTLQHMGIMDGGYAFSHDARKLDRFNTAAIHVMFQRIDDAARVQAVLRRCPLFVEFRGGTCVVTTALE